MKKISLTLSILFLSVSIFANAEEPVTPNFPDPSIGLSITELLIIALLLFVGLLVLVSNMLFKAFKVMYNDKLNLNKTTDKSEVTAEVQQPKIGLWEKLLSLKPMEEEKNLEIPHVYDGIKELNNPIPTWFNVLFYGSLIFAVGYYYYYHIGEYGPRQDTEYEIEMAKAELDKRKFLAQSTGSYDENSVKLDASLIANGKNVYDANCVACHGDQGQGGAVGPNLVDEYWLHGGSINDIFKTIKYGVPEKGMVSWEKNLSAKNISEVTNYIMSLSGTKPANAKAPQGELYKAESESVQDTVKNESDLKK